MAFLDWLEQLSFSHWLNGSPSVWGFPMFLFAHTLGMSVVAGGSVVFDLAVLGIWRSASLASLQRLFPVLITGFAVNAVTGISLFVRDATSYGRNVDFYIKLAFVAAGMVLLVALKADVFTDRMRDNGSVSRRSRRLAWASLVCWCGAIVTGRLIAYVGPVAGL